VGIVVGAYTVSALVCRPFVGRLADRRGRRLTVVGGALLVSLAGVLYLVPAGVAGLIGTRLILGVGEGAMVVAGSAWVVDLAPVERRGQVIGLFGLGIWGGLAIGPPLGVALLATGGYAAVWIFAALGPLIGALVATRVPDLHVPAASDVRLPLLPRAAVAPGVSIFFASVGFAALAGFVVLHLAERGSGAGSAVFITFAASVVGTRLMFGSAPDRLGPGRTAVAAGLLETVGLLLIASAGSWPLAALGALIMGAGFAVLYPALALIVMDRTDDRARGASLGAFSAFFDLGVGIGAPAAGAIAAVAGYPAAFYMAAACAAAGAVASLAFSGLSRRRKLEAASPA